MCVCGAWQLIALVGAMSTDTMAFECHTLTVAGCVLERGGRVLDVEQVVEVVHKVGAPSRCQAVAGVCVLVLMLVALVRCQRICVGLGVCAGVCCVPG